MAKFSETEQKVIDILQKIKNVNQTIRWRNKTWYILEVAKPTTPQGEPKTDVYILLEDELENLQEIKISIKQGNADFLENKIQPIRAEQLLGKDWSKIIEESTTTIKKRFEQKNLIFRNKEARTEEGAITLGWKFELLNKKGGQLSGEIKVSALEVYSGQSLSDDKKNAYIKDKKVKDSGIANYIFIADDKALEDINNNIPLISIEDYVKDNPTIYFACKALNLRTKQNPYKWDGNRPLAVYVDWSIENGKLKSSIKYNNPLETKGNEIANNLIKCLGELSISNTDDIDESNTISNLN